jgi:hypothetical protein
MVACDRVAESSAIEAFLRRAPYLHAYELGDLDPREAEHTTWIANEPVDAVVLLYRGLATPTIIALADGDPAALHALLAGNAHALPPRFYAHLTPGIEAALAPRFTARLLGHHLKMGRASETTGGAAGAIDAAIVQLTPQDAAEAVAFYAASYPASYFEPVNLERGPYVAIRDEHGLAAIAGVHVYSPAMRVASLGNIATRPDAPWPRVRPARHRRAVPAARGRGRRHRAQRPRRQRRGDRVLPRGGVRRAPRVRRMARHLGLTTPPATPRCGQARSGSLVRRRRPRLASTSRWLSAAVRSSP